jgi:hypothetical protein
VQQKMLREAIHQEEGGIHPDASPCQREACCQEA